MPSGCIHVLIEAFGYLTDWEALLSLGAGYL